MHTIRFYTHTYACINAYLSQTQTHTYIHKLSVVYVCVHIWGLMWLGNSVMHASVSVYACICKCVRSNFGSKILKKLWSNNNLCLYNRCALRISINAEKGRKRLVCVTAVMEHDIIIHKGVGAKTTMVRRKQRDEAEHLPGEGRQPWKRGRRRRRRKLPLCEHNAERRRGGGRETQRRRRRRRARCLHFLSLLCFFIYILLLYFVCY